MPFSSVLVLSAGSDPLPRPLLLPGPWPLPLLPGPAAPPLGPLPVPPPMLPPPADPPADTSPAPAPLRLLPPEEPLLATPPALPARPVPEPAVPIPIEFDPEVDRPPELGMLRDVIDPVAVSPRSLRFSRRCARGRMAQRQTSWPLTIRRRQLPYMDALTAAGWHCWPDLGIWAWTEADEARNRAIADKARACERFMVHLTRD